MLTTLSREPRPGEQTQKYPTRRVEADFCVCSAEKVGA
jgi:hypothetical protein